MPSPGCNWATRCAKRIQRRPDCASAGRTSCTRRSATRSAFLMPCTAWAGRPATSEILGQPNGLWPRCLRLRREAGDGIGAAEATSLLGHIALWQGEFARAEHLLRQSLTKHRMVEFLAKPCRCSSPVALKKPAQRQSIPSSSILIWGSVARWRTPWSSWASAISIWVTITLQGLQAREGLALAQRVGFPRGVGMCQGLLGAIALAEGAYGEAHARCEASLAVWQQSSGHPSEFEGELACLALAASGMGYRAEAWEHLRAQLAWAQESQMLMPGLFGLVGARSIAGRRGRGRARDRAVCPGIPLSLCGEFALV